ncbi:hypothetical protein SHVI106290_02245 [Shewanella violacea]
MPKNDLKCKRVCDTPPYLLKKWVPYSLCRFKQRPCLTASSAKYVHIQRPVQHPCFSFMSSWLCHIHPASRSESITSRYLILSRKVTAAFTPDYSSLRFELYWPVTRFWTETSYRLCTNALSSDKKKYLSLFKSPNSL